MEMTRFSITIPKNLKQSMEELAVLNFRTLNGEISKALDLYIKGVNGQIVAPEPIHYTPTVQTMVIDSAPVEENINQFTNEEVEEF